jgi:hypothetical protein
MIDYRSIGLVAEELQQTLQIHWEVGSAEKYQDPCISSFNHGDP